MTARTESRRSPDPQWQVKHTNGDVTTVRAPTEKEARRRAMVAKYGSRPDVIVPNAPQYEGLGLSVTRMAKGKVASAKDADAGFPQQEDRGATAPGART